MQLSFDFSFSAPPPPVPVPVPLASPDPRRTLEVIVNALRGPAPCDRCMGAARCGSLELACSAFSGFVSGKKWLDMPRNDATADRFDLIFNEATEEAA